MTVSGAPEAVRLLRRPGLAAVVALFLSVVVVVASSAMALGVITPLGDSLGVSPALIGYGLTMSSVLAAMISPYTPRMTGRFDRGRFLAGVVALTGAANVIAACARNFIVMGVALGLLGVVAGLSWSILPAVVPRVAGWVRTSVALSVVFSGSSISFAVVLPGLTAWASAFGWRAAFWLLGASCAVVVVLLVVVVPPLPPDLERTSKHVREVLRNGRVRVSLAVTALCVGAHYCGYTYARPMLEEGIDASDSVIVVALGVFGFAAIAGNVMSGLSAERLTGPVTMVVFSSLVIGTTALALIHATALVFVAMGVWGIAYGGLSLLTQAWVRHSEPVQREATSALWAGTFNLAMALGTGLGALAYQIGDAALAMLVAGSLALVGAAFAANARPAPVGLSAVPEHVGGAVEPAGPRLDREFGN